MALHVRGKVVVQGTRACPLAQASSLRKPAPPPLPDPYPMPPPSPPRPDNMAREAGVQQEGHWEVRAVQGGHQ